MDDEVDPAAAAELAAAGTGCRSHGGQAAAAEGFSLQANPKTLEGAQHPDRDAQFRYINDQPATSSPPATR